MYNAGDLDPNENPENIIELRYQVDNTKNTIKIDEVVVQLIQVVAIKDGKESDTDKKFKRHVQEIIYERKFEGLCAKDQTDKPKAVRISLAKLNKKVLKR